VKARAPRQLVFQGRVLAHGVAVSRALLGEKGALSRVLSLAHAGTRVTLVGGHFVVQWVKPQWLRVANAPGAPLVLFQGALWAAPWPERKDQAPHAGAGQVVLVVGGVLEVHTLRPVDAVDLALWVDVTGVAVVDTQPLGAQPVAAAAPPAALDVRTALTVGTAPPQAAEVARALREGGAQGGAAGWLGQLLQLVLHRLRGVKPRPDTQRSGALEGTQPPMPGLWDRLGRWLNNTLWKGALGNLLLKRHAQYLHKVMELFEGGNLEEALRHAIPLGRGGGGPATHTPLGLPGARQDLRIGARARAGGGALGLAEDLFGHLERLYRNAVDRLVRAGRFEEAAFVLAELLNQDAEAVALLEQHGLLERAAEVAEAHGLPPGMPVRLYFLAGKVERAVDLARRHGAFADAVARLERGNAAQATALRILWANALAESGNYLGAVEVAWHLGVARGLALEWLRRAVEGGGVGGARALGRLLWADVNSFPLVRDHVVAQLEDASPEAARCRVPLVEALLESHAGRVLARPALRRVWQDAQQGHVTLSASRWRKLVQGTQDPVFRADAPSPPRQAWPTLSERADPLLIIKDASDVGTLRAQDGLFLPDGRVALALGSLGVRVLSRSGATSFTMDEPADRLVPSEHGDRALGVWRLPEADAGTVRVSTLDWTTGRGRAWLQQRLLAFSRDHDGSLWMVGAGGDLQALDLAASIPRVLWRVPDVGQGQPAAVRCVARSAASLAFVSTPLDGVKGDTVAWRYDVPAMALRERRDLVDVAPQVVVAMTVNAGGQVFRLTEPSRTGGLVLHSHWLHGPSLQTVVAPPVAEHGSPRHAGALLRASGPWVVAGYRVEAGWRVALLDTANLRVRLEVFLQGRRKVNAHLQDEHLVLVDDCGTVLVVDLKMGQLVRDLRI